MSINPADMLIEQPPAAAAPAQTTLVVSLHMPKTAGTSFSATLRARFGDRYRADYADLPLQLPRILRYRRALAEAWRLRRDGLDAECVHGHFLPVKYRLGLGRRPMIYVTWLRDPVERIVSHYEYWRRGYDGGDPAQPLRNRMVAERWSLERFALGPEMRNLYCQYLWNFPPSRFDFIGITEHYDDDVARLAQRHLGCEPKTSFELVNPQRGHRGYAIDSTLRQRVERHHAGDVKLYRWALGRRLAAGGRELPERPLF